jgi:ATPase subunit of ABC transporter with duplicated ATPase domains
MVGPNGAGRTTLLRLAAGLLMPSTGEVTILGASPHRDPATVLPRIGFLAQDHAGEEEGEPDGGRQGDEREGQPPRSRGRRPDR